MKSAHDRSKKMRIPINDIKRHLSGIRDVIAPAVGRVLDSGWYIFGEENEAFEREFAAYCRLVSVEHRF